MDFRGDLDAGFALDLERVFRGERCDGPGCGATAGSAAVCWISGFWHKRSSFSDPTMRGEAPCVSHVQLVWRGHP